MGYTLPEWADEVLDYIGINFPNVDEDDYREMADGLREFADGLDDHGAEAHRAVQRLLASGEGAAADALEAHWSKVKGHHIHDVVDVSRTFADAMDVVAGLIEGMKRKAEVELGVMAAAAGISLAAAVFTGGLSALAGAAASAACREAIRRAIKEAAEAIVEELVAKLTEPVVAKLENMAADLLVELGSEALGLPGGDGPPAGKDATQLNSAPGSAGLGSGPGKTGKLRFDHEEHNTAATALAGLASKMDSGALAKLDKADNSHGRARGKDAFTAPFDSLIAAALKATKKAAPALKEHISDGMTRAIRTTAKNHKRNEDGIVDDLRSINSKADADGPRGGRGPGGRPSNVKPDSMDKSQSDLRLTGRDAKNRVCKTDPVDVASGEMLLTQTDLALPGVLPLVVTRTHLSTYRYGQFFGPSWASTLDERLEVDTRGRVLWAREDGSILSYPQLPAAESDEEVWPDEGPRLPLSYQGTGAMGEVTYRITDPHTGITRAFADSPTRRTGWYWLTYWQDRNSNEVDVARLEDGTPTTLIHSGGYRVNLHCTAGRLKRLTVTTPDGPVEVMSYGHDAAGNLTHVTNSSGQPLVFDYDADSRITAWTDRNDSTYRYVYDDANRVTETIGPDGYLSSRWAYDREQRQTRFTDACGATTVYRLNALHQITAETDPLGNVTTSEWDRYDNLLARTDPLGNTTRFEYDDARNLTAVHLPDERTATATYDELNLPTSSTGPDGSTWRQEFDEWGNLTSVTAPDGTTNRFTHHRTGAVASATDPSGAATTYTVDDAGLPVAVTDVAGHTATVERDAFGRPTAVTDPLGAITRAVWTVEGHITERITADGRREQLTWDGEGNCLTHTDAAGGTTSFEYTHFDKLAARTGPDGVRYAFAYDAELRLTQVTNPQGLTWDYRYDRVGNLTAESDFDDREVAYAHDALGRVVSRRTPLGEEIAYTYNVLGQLSAKDAAGARTEYAYDAAGALISAASPTSTLAFERDVMGRLLAETVDGRTTRYTYDLLGRRTTRTTPTGACTSFSYDAAGNRNALTSDGHRLDFTHDALGRELTRVLGTGAAPVAMTTAWDMVGRPVAHGLATPGRTLRARTYAYRADNHVTSITDEATGIRQQMELDPAGRPLTVTADGWTESYAYDQAGNQTSATWPEDAGRAEARGAREYTGTRVLSAGAVRYEHDAAGRMVLRQKRRLSKKPDTWRYEWDAEDRLTSCVTPDGTRWRYTYDPMGRRTAKYRMAADDSVAEAVYFSWDGTRLAEQTDTTTGVTLTWDHEGHRPLTQLERKPRTQDEYDSRFFAIVTDLVGTPTELVDETGHIAWHTRTTLWGTTTRNRDATATTPLRFPGQYEDPETGLHYNYFRHYDPETARYASPDPLGLAPAPNPVGYVHNPHDWLDPLGLTPCETVTVYRKQDTNIPQTMRMQVDANGNVSLSGSGSLYLNMTGDIAHSTGFKGNQIVAFDVPKSLVDRISADSLPQRQPSDWSGTAREWNRARKVAPDQSDGPGLFGLPDNQKFGTDYHQMLMDAIIPGSGRVVDPN